MSGNIFIHAQSDKYFNINEKFCQIMRIDIPLNFQIFTRAQCLYVFNRD